MDEQIAFYWRHREQIEEWAALRPQARGLLIERLRAEADRLQEFADVSEDVEFVDRSDFPLLGLTRPSWRARGHEVAVALGWSEKNLLSASGSHLPWVGLRLGRGDDRRARSQTVRQAVEPHIGDLSWSRTETGWPAWTFLEPGSEQGLENFARWCVTEVIEGWEKMYRVLDDALS
jgi:hypothetical protein